MILIRLVLMVSLCLQILGDEGEWLGEKIGAAATKLKNSPDRELILQYTPASGVNQRYSIGIGKSPLCGQPCNATGGLTVEVERGRHGSTTYHRRFVVVPAPLKIEKNGQPTQIVLRKNGDTIELIELR